MTITEFLLARITEDEVKATLRTVHAEDCGWIPNEAGYSYPWNCGVPERMAAECAAKRATIRDHAEMVSAIDYLSAALPGNLNQNPDAPFRTAPLRNFAAIYSDHPDYQQEWTL